MNGGIGDSLMIGSTILDYFITRKTAAMVWTTVDSSRQAVEREQDFSRSGHDSILQSKTINAR
jgi:hypothetical protein